MRETSRMAAVHSRSRRATQSARISAAAVIGHASYRVRHASANAVPTAPARSVLVHGAEGGAAHHAMRSAIASVVEAMSSGSLIGVDCRYTTFGLSENTAAATTPAAVESVAIAAIQAIDPAANANAATEIATADAPVR